MGRRVLTVAVLILVVTVAVANAAQVRSSHTHATPAAVSLSASAVASPWPVATPVDDATLQRLVIFGFALGETPHTVPVATLGSTIGLQPGAELALVLGVFDHEVCGIGVRCFVPVSVSAMWSIVPTDGARIQPATGLLTIDPATPSGVFTVRADVEGGRRVIAADVHVYTPGANPLVGVWTEVAQLPCQGGAEVAPEEPIAELVFAADGTFAVTWFPFESYVDYWGTYAFDLERGTLDLVVTGGNFVPPDIDGQGQFAMDAAGSFVLLDLWLGTPPIGAGAANCGHRFA